MSQQKRGWPQLQLQEPNHRVGTLQHTAVWTLPTQISAMVPSYAQRNFCLNLSYNMRSPVLPFLSLERTGDRDSMA
jgi:hypothetical protein